jgi:ABC-2 type transport system ATP-binding protein
MWSVISDLVQDGTTVLLTTQYLEEADQLAERIVVLDHGRVIAQGSADQLKTQVGGDRIEVVVGQGVDLNAASSALAAAVGSEVTAEDVERKLVAPVATGSAAIIAAVRALDEKNIAIDDIALRRPTLDDVFLSLTGHVAQDESQPAAPAARGRKGRGR